MDKRKAIHPDIIRQIFILLVILFLGGLIFREMQPYLTGVLGAVTLYVILRKPMARLVKKGWHIDLAAGVLMGLSFFGILIPLAGITVLLGSKLDLALENSKAFTATLKQIVRQWESQLGFEMQGALFSGSATEWAKENLQYVAGNTFEIFIAIGILYVMLYYMLTNRKQFRESLYAYIPIKKTNLKLIGQEVQAMVKANAMGIPLVALAQGMVALVGFLIFRIPEPFFWAVIVFVGSMIPFIGTLIGTVPVFLIALYQGNMGQAWGILAYGIVVVGATDNLIRLYVLKKLDNVHPLITLVGVVVGIPIFGFIGLIFGPLIVSLLLIVVRIYKREYGKKNPSQIQQL